MAKNLTKIFRPSKGENSPLCMAQIHSNHYDSSMSHILSMVKELKKAFPKITNDEITIGKYGGNRIKGITFVEVALPRNTKAPEGFDVVTDLEYIL